MQQGARDDNLFVQFQTLIVVAAMNMGYYISVADDLGPQAAYRKSGVAAQLPLLINFSASGFQMAYATLDSLRATLKSTEFTGISPKPLITMNGYSAGGLSVGWVSNQLCCEGGKLTILRLLSSNRHMPLSLKSLVPPSVDWSPI
jgi:hypothetical protein